MFSGFLGTQDFSTWQSLATSRRSIGTGWKRPMGAVHLVRIGNAGTRLGSSSISCQMRGACFGKGALARQTPNVLPSSPLQVTPTGFH